MVDEFTEFREFDGFRLDVVRKILWHHDEIVSLPLKAVELLIALTEKNGEVASKSELMETVWEESFVEESNLSHNIYLLRKTLKSYGGEDLIQTVPRRGYRFTGKLNESRLSKPIEDEESEEITIEQHTLTRIGIEEIYYDSPALPAPQNSLPDKQTASFLNAKTILAVAIMLLVIAGGLAIWRANQPKIKTDFTTIKSIAILPVKSFTANAAIEPLNMQITDALITRLGGLHNISIRPTNSILPFVKDDSTIIEIGRKLEVDAVLDGRIQQEGNKLRVNLQLVSVESGENLWSEQFDGEVNQLLNLQDAIASKLLSRIAVPLTQTETLALAKRPTESAEAYENYLQGRYFWQKRDEESLRKAISFFEIAKKLDPNFAEAYAGLADAHYLLFDYSYDSAPENVVKAKENLLTSIALNPALAEAYVTLGLIQTTFERDWRQAEQSFQKALELSPASPNVHHRRAMLLLKLRRFEEAEAEIRRAKELDPTSSGINMNLGVILYFSKKYDAAIEQLNKTIALDEKFISPRWYKARCYWAKGEKIESLKAYKIALQMSDYQSIAEDIDKTLATTTPERIVENWAVKWREDMSPTSINEHDMAILAALAQNREDTLLWLEKSVAVRHPWATLINAEPEFDFLRNDEKFQSILQSLNLK